MPLVADEDDKYPEWPIVNDGWGRLQKNSQMFIKMNDLLINDFVVVPLVHRADVVAISSRLDGFELTPWDRNTWKIKDWKFKKTS